MSARSDRVRRSEVEARSGYDVRVDQIRLELEFKRTLQRAQDQARTEREREDRERDARDER